MALSDFLADGSQLPAGVGVKSMTSQTVLPEWYTNYAMQLLSNQQAVAARPYATYQAPRVVLDGWQTRESVRAADELLGVLGVLLVGVR